MRQPGGMFLQDSDLADFDAGFFEVGSQEATAMDPNQRYMLEVVYECMENAGISIESVDNKPVGCYVGSFSSDYADMANRDPEDRPLGVSLCVARTVLANRLSHFLNIKAPASRSIPHAPAVWLVSTSPARPYTQETSIWQSLPRPIFFT